MVHNGAHMRITICIEVVSLKVTFYQGSTVRKCKRWKGDIAMQGPQRLSRQMLLFHDGIVTVKGLLAYQICAF